MKDLLNKVEGKLRMLKFTSDETPSVLEENKQKQIERHAKVLESLIEEVHELKVEVQRERIEKGDDPTEVRTWSRDLEQTVLEFENVISEVKQHREKLCEIELQKAKNKETEIVEEKRRKRYDEEIALEEAKLEMKRKFEKGLEEAKTKSASQCNSAKLPKLVISKFQGTHLDWQRFWGQFETEIDKADISPITKLSYLKELLLPKVRAFVDGLPFSTEGYERAKTILKTRYGKESEVANAHIQSIISLPTVPGTDAKKINRFFETLVANTQTLETMGKLKEVKGFVRSTLDKLPGIRADLVRSDDDWQEWGFSEMVEALRKWCVRNPISEEDRKSDHKGTSHYQPKSGKFLHAKQELWKPKPCVFCESTLHKSVDCNQVVDVPSRKKILSEKKLCFNCTGVKHRASECRSKTTCFRCNAKHHTSICDDQASVSNQMMLTTGKGTVVYPVVVAVVDGIKCRALLDTGAGSSYISAELVKLLKKQPSRTEYRRIDMMMSSTTQRIEIYDVAVADVRGKFEMKTQVSKVAKSVLLSIPNPGYADILSQNHHLRGVKMDDEDTKAELPIHLILGAGDYSRIKTTTKPKLGQPGQPTAELTFLGWTIMSAGGEVDFSNVYLTKSSAADYEELCSLDVLGLKDHLEQDQQFVYKEFQEQLTQSDDGWYETGLLWKPGHEPLPSNERNSLGRLSGLLKKLRRDPELLTQYDDIIRDQLNQGIVEKVANDPEGKEFYLPHRPVIRKSAESTKVRIVYDASSKESDSSPSLNDCLETGPPLQNLLWDVLVRNRMKPVALSGDLKQAFLQVRVRAQDRDSLRFHWIKDKDLSTVEVLRFTRALFGLVQSPFLLGGTIRCLLESMRQKYPTEVAEIEKSLYVDDVISGGETTEAVHSLKAKAVEIFERGKFTFHKLHSPISLVGKLIYRDVCDQRWPWDAELLPQISNRWRKLENALPEKVEVPRSITVFEEPIEAVHLHAFGDTSSEGTCAAVYAVVHQQSGVNQGLIAAKSRLAKKNLTIPRLELVSAHMASTLVDNVKNALSYPVTSVFGWLDSTTALYWIKGNGNYKQFVANRTRKINAKDYIQWRHVGTHQNPADLGSRGYLPNNLSESWLKGPEWLPSPDQWPEDIVAQPGKESESEVKLINNLFAAAVEVKDEVDELLQKHTFWKSVRILGWITRFVNNCKAKLAKTVKQSGPLTTTETEVQVELLVKKFTERQIETEQFKNEQLRLNLQRNVNGLFECRGRIQGLYPIYVPPGTLLSEKMIEDAHVQTLHGGVGLTMALIRQRYWIPRLRQSTKKVIASCHGCKRFQVTAYHNPPVGNLPLDRTVGSTPFEVLGVDYAGPLIYKINKTKDGKAYILLFACSLTRSIHLELLPDQTTENFIKSFKQFIARRGRPRKVYSDNGKTFVAAAKWISKIMKDERFHDYLAHQQIVWQFNLSKAPWWGGQFERMVGLVKRALYKTIGRANLRWDELEEVILDVEITLNNRPLTYQEDDVQLPTLTRNVMMFGQPNNLPEEDASEIEDHPLRKRATYLARCKDVLWSRWTNEYLRGLRERHDLRGGEIANIKIGQVVLIKNDERNRGKWNLGVVVKPIKGRDGVVRAVRLRAGKSYLERAVQQLYPLELECDDPPVKKPPVTMNAEAREFRPKRKAAKEAEKLFKNIAEFELES